MIELHPKYNHIATQDNMCVAACVQMVFQRRQIHYPSQQEITDILGEMKEDGLHIDKDGFERLFQRHNIKLEERCFSINEVWEREYACFIEENIRADNDIIAFYTYSLLFDNKPEEGHASLIESVDRDSIILVDPNSEHYEVKELDVRELVQAMAPEGWFSVISKK